MRPKVVIVVLLAGLAGLAIIFSLKRPANPTPGVVPILPEVAAASPAKPLSFQASRPTNAPALAAPVKPVKPIRPIPFTTPSATGPDAALIQAQLDRLDELEANDDDASLQAILKELTNTNQLIRHAAIEATIQFGGHTAVPVLKDLAGRTADPDEKQELLDAAEFLALPTISEVRAQKQQEQMQEADPPQ